MPLTKKEKRILQDNICLYLKVNFALWAINRKFSAFVCCFCLPFTTETMNYYVKKSCFLGREYILNRLCGMRIEFNWNLLELLLSAKFSDEWESFFHVIFALRDLTFLMQSLWCNYWKKVRKTFTLQFRFDGAVDEFDSWKGLANELLVFINLQRNFLGNSKS